MLDSYFWHRRQHVHSEIKEVIKPFDWSYTTDYKGTLLPKPPSPTTLESPPVPSFSPSETPLPVHLLTRPDPIVFYTSTDLFEDELADNGMSVLTTKVRVMPQRLLLLSRFFMRLDDVLFRIRDTRVYIEFATGEVVREYTAREEKYSVVKGKLGGGGDVAGLMREPDKLMGVCPVVETVRERLVLPR
jgi:type 2A phosphatase activator TIP41